MKEKRCLEKRLMIYKALYDEKVNEFSGLSRA